MTYQLRPSNALEVAERRWQEIMEGRPDLEPAIALQRRLVTRSLALEVVIDHQLPVTVDFDRIEVATKLQRKTPVFAGEAIAVDAGPVIPFVLGFCEDLASGETGGAAERLGRTLDRAEIDVGSLLSASLGRRQEAIRNKAHHVGVAPDLLWLVAELASGPVAHRLQHQLLAELPGQEGELRSVVRGWTEGFCAACGSWPALGESIPDRPSRSLRCSYCGSAWTPTPQRCIYCEETGESLVVAAVDPEQPSQRVELCRTCGGYLKCIEVECPTPFQLLPLEDLSTCGLDLGAVEQGYGRPPMHTFATDDSLPCPPPTA